MSSLVYKNVVFKELRPFTKSIPVSIQESEGRESTREEFFGSQATILLMV